jgi:hypothetical protein
MRALFTKWKTWACLCLVAVLTLLLWRPVQQARNVAAVQNCLQRGWEVTFGTEGCPASLPKFIDSAADDFFSRIFVATRGYDGSQPAPTRNRDIIYQERFRALFRDPIDEIHIYDPEAFRGDLGAALARFPRLRRASVFESESLPTEAEWTRLCMWLRSFPHLEEIELGGAWVTDAAIAPLAKHPQLHTISIAGGRLTAECTKTFASMPHLTRLHIEGQIPEDENWLSPDERKAMSAALPAVTIEFPK